MLRYLTSGESHGPQLTAILSGLPAGLPISAEAVNADLKRRQGGYGRGGRMKIETDSVRFVSGVRHGRAMGSPITMIIENRDWRNWQEIMAAEVPDDASAAGKRAITRPRPGHADLPGVQKFALDDARDVLERASARATTTQVAIGTLCRALLAEFGIHVYSHVVNLCGIQVSRAAVEQLTWRQRHERAEQSELRVADPAAEPRMRELIDACKRDGDTAGGVFEVAVTGLPAGLGNVMNWDEKLDGRIGQVMMSMQAIKGVEIGEGFAAALKPGSQVHDPIYYSTDPGQWPDGHGPSGGFYRKTNGAGGLEGGMTNGEPLVVRAAMKPISTLMRPIQSVDFLTHQPYNSSKERSDVCALPAAAVVGEALVAYAVAMTFLEKFGGDSLAEVRRNYEGYCAGLGKQRAVGSVEISRPAEAIAILEFVRKNYTTAELWPTRRQIGNRFSDEFPVSSDADADEASTSIDRLLDELIAAGMLEEVRVDEDSSISMDLSQFEGFVQTLGQQLTSNAL